MDGYNSLNHKKLYKIALYIAVSVVLTCFLTFQGFIFCESKTAASAATQSGEIVMEATTKRVLFASNQHTRMEPASTTKAMTALIILERCRPDEVVTVPKAAVGIEGSSIYLKEGEKLTVKELLYGLMLRSGNDAATALAIHAAGSPEKFAELMNQKTKALGLKNTHFTNPHGLHDDEHYTSAYDLAYIASEGMLNPVFREIVSTKGVKIQGGSVERYFYNKNKILSRYNGGNGVKTGFTKAAGRCLIASSVRDGMQVVAVTLNRSDMFERCAYLMDYAHDNYCMQKVCEKGYSAASLPVVKGKAGSVGLCFDKDLYYPVKKDGSEEIKTVMRLPDNILAPCRRGSRAGEADFYLNNHLLFSEKLYTINDVEKKGFLDYFREKLYP